MSSGNVSAERIAGWVGDARLRTFEMVEDLTDDQLRVPLLEIVNPLLWEIGHIAWFQEHWVLRHVLGSPPLLEGADTLYDSAAVRHDTRWELALPTRAATREYMTAVMENVLSHLGRAADLDERERYFNLLAVFHEDMHGEAFMYMRQTLGYPLPSLTECAFVAGPRERTVKPEGDAEVPGGSLSLGTTPDTAFAFDNERWAHPVDIEPFGIARAPVTEDDFAAFVDDGGYRRRELWCDDGWRWRQTAAVEHPLYFVRGGDGRWRRRHFDRVLEPESDRPMIHVNWYEADAYCRWAGRRLPAEAEWEAAAAGEPSAAGYRLAVRKRRYPWGDTPPDPTRANLDGCAMDTVDVGALEAGDSAFGCRQMLGNVWEWTDSVLAPYPGFASGPYTEYSEPWFGTRRVLRGGAWATRSRMVHNTYRNFYPPYRRDVFAGFRTCRAR